MCLCTCVHSGSWVSIRLLFLFYISCHPFSLRFFGCFMCQLQLCSHLRLFMVCIVSTYCFVATNWCGFFERWPDINQGFSRTDILECSKKIPGHPEICSLFHCAGEPRVLTERCLFFTTVCQGPTEIRLWFCVSRTRVKQAARTRTTVVSIDGRIRDAGVSYLWCEMVGFRCLFLWRRFQFSFHSTVCKKRNS